MPTIYFASSLPLVLQQGVEGHVVARQVRCRQALEVTQEAEGLAAEQRGLRVHVQVDRVVATVSALEQPQRVAAHHAHRADLDDATALRGDREQLLGLLAGSQTADRELATSGADHLVPGFFVYGQ